MHSWPRLHQGIEESRDDLRVRHKISRAAQEWFAEDQAPVLLYRGTPLLAATEWLAKNPGLLNPAEQAFLDASVADRDQRETAERERRRRNRRWAMSAVVALTLLAIGATVSSFIAYNKWQESEQNWLASQRNAERADAATQRAESRFASALGAAAFGQVEEDPRLALVLAAESTAMSLPQAAPYDTRAALVSARHTLAEGGPFLFGGPLVASNALAIALNPQGSILAIGSVDGSVELINTANRKPIQAPVNDHKGGIRDLEFSPDGREFITASADGTLRRWQRQTTGQWGSQLLASSSDVIVDVDFMPDGRSVFSANDDGTVQRYYLDGRTEQPPPIAVADYGFNALAISRDGRYVIAGNTDKRIVAHDIATGEQVLGPIETPARNHLVDISFNHDGSEFATVDTGGFANVLSFENGERVDSRFDFSDRMGVLFFHPDGERVFSGDGTGRLNQWWADTGTLQRQSAPGHSQILMASTLSGDGSVLVTLGRDQVIRFWTLDERFPLAQSWQTAGSAAKGVSISRDGHLLAMADKNGLIQLRRTDTTDRPIQLRGHMSGVWALAFSSDNKLLASADRAGQIRVWDSTTGRLHMETALDAGSIWSLAFANNDQSLLAGADSGVFRLSLSARVWGDAVVKTQANLTRFYLSIDGRRLAVSDAVGSIKLVDLETGDVLLDIAGDNDTIWSVALSADGRSLAAASSEEIVSLFSVDSGKRIARLTGHAGGTTDVGFLADGETLVASDRKGRLHWWDTATKRRLALPIQAHRRTIWRMQVHPNGTHVVTAGDDGFVRLWNVLDTHRACTIGLPGFDATRRAQYLGPDRDFAVCKN
ncbi:MAG: WD40 repeat domain-containing protein [Pseudomonadota bacterium]